MTTKVRQKKSELHIANTYLKAFAFKSSMRYYTVGTFKIKGDKLGNKVSHCNRV